MQAEYKNQKIKNSFVAVIYFKCLTSQTLHKQKGVQNVDHQIHIEKAPEGALYAKDMTGRVRTPRIILTIHFQELKHGKLGLEIMQRERRRKYPLDKARNQSWNSNANELLLRSYYSVTSRLSSRKPHLPRFP